MYTVILPLDIQVSKNKKFILNLNNYRNTHYQTLNKSKVNFSEYVINLMKNQDTLPIMDKISITYVLYVGDKRKKDLSNVCSIVDKYFCDALVSQGIIPDDNYEHVPEVNFRYGGYDKSNPRVEAHITPI